MWLVNTTTLELHNFLDAENAPKYAILSHCWGDEEMTFKDFRKRRSCAGKGYQKIVDCCQFALDYPLSCRSGHIADSPQVPPCHGFDWVWIDTVCIDKRSSAELSEAINSMHEWYMDATVCFAYLEDIDIGGGCSDLLEVQLQRSRWFTRGWTLQELIAPGTVYFLDAGWRCFGQKSVEESTLFPQDSQGPPTISGILEAITGIPRPVLDGDELVDEYSVAERMSWASRRVTSRKEDKAYCLLGIFGVNMPLIYGEGSDAFQRLQRHILSKGHDDSIFAWSIVDDFSRYFAAFNDSRMLVSSPGDFATSKNVLHNNSVARSVLSARGNGWQVEVTQSSPPSVFYNPERDHGILVIRLQCVQLKIDAEMAEHVSPVILALSPTRCGHFARLRSAFDTFRDSAKGPAFRLAAFGLMSEDCLLDHGEWRPVEAPYTCLVHSDSLDTYECGQWSGSQRMGNKDVVYRLGETSPKARQVLQRVTAHRLSLDSTC